VSFLVFDGDELRLSLFDSKGKLVDSWWASNRGGPHSDFRIDKAEAFVTYIPDGKYPFEAHSQSAPELHRKAGLDTLTGPYGTLGILKLKPIPFGGHVHEGLVIHAGRQAQMDSTVIWRKPLQQVHHAGAFHRTSGCIRSTEQAMHKIAATISKDRLEFLKVQNNGRHPLEKVSGSEVNRI